MTDTGNELLETYTSRIYIPPGRDQSHSVASVLIPPAIIADYESRRIGFDFPIRR
jgi:hypothetical protein